MAVPDDEAIIANPAAAWDAAADAWDEFVETGLDYWRTDLHGPSLLAACGEVAGVRVLDLGCGQGWFSRQLAAHGANVVGIDLSEAQLANARRHETLHPLGITYHHLNATMIASHWPPESFDLITACMSLHDTPHAGEILHAARHLLPPHGRMAFSMPHPVAAGPNTGWAPTADQSKGQRWMDHYFAMGPAVLHWRMTRLTRHWSTPHWHRTLSEWSTLIRDAGLVIERIEEPFPTAEQVTVNPSLEPARRIPFFLVVALSVRQD